MEIVANVTIEMVIGKKQQKYELNLRILGNEYQRPEVEPRPSKITCLQSDIALKKQDCAMYLFSDNITISVTGDIELKLGDYF